MKNIFKDKNKLKKVKDKLSLLLESKLIKKLQIIKKNHKIYLKVLRKFNSLKQCFLKRNK